MSTRLTRRGEALAAALLLLLLVAVLTGALIEGQARLCDWRAQHDPALHATTCAPAETSR